MKQYSSFLRAYLSFQNFRYRLQNRRYLYLNADNPHLLIHCPKSGGTSISRALGLVGPGHFSLLEQLKSRPFPPRHIVMCLRDPLDRMISTYKYAQKPLHRRMHASLHLVGRYASFDDFVASPTFDEFVRHHYFFRPIAEMALGIKDVEIPVIYLDFRNIVLEAQSKLGIDLGIFNTSPDVSSTRASYNEDTLRKIVRIYSEDYEFIDHALNQSSPK